MLVDRPRSRVPLSLCPRRAVCSQFSTLYTRRVRGYSLRRSMTMSSKEPGHKRFVERPVARPSVAGTGHALESRLATVRGNGVRSALSQIHYRVPVIPDWPDRLTDPHVYSPGTRHSGAGR